MIHAWASQPHHLAHCAPVWAALPPEAKGTFTVPQPRLKALARTFGIDARLAAAPPSRSRHKPAWTLLAGGGDLHHVRGQAILIEHGAGQTYEGVDHPSWPGGRGREKVGLFLVPRQQTADVNLARYPNSTAAVVGAPHLESLITHRATHRPDPNTLRVVISRHWDSWICPETRTAWPHHEPGIPQLTGKTVNGREVTVALHAHPRALRDARVAGARLGLPVVGEFREVLGWADCYMVDNSSTLWEAARLGVPVVALNAPWYRRGVHHGLRYWGLVPGPQVDDPDGLLEGIEASVTPGWVQERERVSRAVFPFVEGSAARAAGACVARLVG